MVTAPISLRRGNRAHVGISLLLAAAASAWGSAAFAQTFKVATWNVRSGHGVQELPGGRRLFTAGSDCAINSWGSGYMKNELTTEVGNDSGVIALGLVESWGNVCASPENIRVHLGWAARSSKWTGNGVGMVARYGFGGPETWRQLDTSLNTNPNDTMWVLHAPVCLDSLCSQVLDVFVAHWYGTGDFSQQTYEKQASETIAFMEQQAGTRPHVLIGDLNVWEDGDTCSATAKPFGIQKLRDAGYVDAWDALRGSDEGYTGMLNRNGCGSPNGDTFKRIDYVWSRGLTPLVIERFGLPEIIGDTGISDHLGLRGQLSFGGGDTIPPSVSISSPADDATVSGTIQISATASDNVGVSRVDFFRGTTLIGSDSSAPYAVNWDTTTVADGSYSLNAQAFDAAGNVGSSAPVSVTVSNGPGGSASWTGLVNTTATGSTIEKTSGCTTCADAGGYTINEIASGDGFAQFTPSWGHRFYVGLGNEKSTSTDPALIDFAFSFWATGAWDIRENNVYKTEGSYAAGDVFKIAIESGVVKYYKNGAVVYTSATAPTYPLVLDTTMVTVGSKVTNASVSGGTTGGGVSWVSVVNATPTGSSLEKTSGCTTCPDAGGVSDQEISTAGGHIEFTPSWGHRFYVGLGNDKTTNTDVTEIDFAFSFWADGTWDIRENNFYRTEGAYVAGDAFKIAVESGVVKYYKNGAVVYTSAVAPTFPLVLDTTMFTVGSKVSNATIVR